MPARKLSFGPSGRPFFPRLAKRVASVLGEENTVWGSCGNAQFLKSHRKGKA